MSESFQTVTLETQRQIYLNYTGKVNIHFDARNLKLECSTLPAPCPIVDPAEYQTRSGYLLRFREGHSSFRRRWPPLYDGVSLRPTAPIYP